MQDIAFYGIIDRNGLQALQDEFCRATGVCAYCLDSGRERLTRLSGSGRDEEMQKLQFLQKAQHVQTALERVEDGALEDVAIEDFPGGTDKVAAVAIRVQGKTVLYWIVFCLSGLDDEAFARTLDLLRDACTAVYSAKMTDLGGKIKREVSAYDRQKEEDALHVTEATNRIVQLLDSDDKIELIMEQWLRTVAEYLQAEAAEIFQLSPDGRTMEILSQYCRSGVASMFDRTRDIPAYEVADTDKPLVFSSGDVPEFLEELGIESVMLFPVIRVENGVRMMLSVNYREESHEWEPAEVKFAADSVKVLQSILTRRIQKNSLASSYTALEAILDNVGCAIYVVDKNSGNVLFENRILKNIFAAQLRDKSFPKLIEQAMCQNGEGGSFEVYQEDNAQWYEMTCKEIAWVDGRRATLYSFYDVTERNLYQRRIEQQAYTDFLTGLYNRMCCERDLAKQIDEAKRTNGTGAILYMDLDDFKHINDGLGHQYGDVLLKSISHSLQRVNGIENSCYRMGGDEFVIVVPPSSYERFDGILEEIRDIFNKPWYLKDTDYYCTTSMGIVTFPDAGDSVSDLIKKADIAMYEAKKGGKNRVARYSDSIDSESGKRLGMEKNMRNAAAEGCREFEVYYQPIINIQGDAPACKGAEALIRWNSPVQGFVAPSDFIPLAEYLGLINPIGNYVLVEACKKCREWNENGHPEFTVNVNLSVVQLLQPNVVEIVEQTLQETGIDPANLILEVTESLAINDMERMKKILESIKAHGVGIALDDFGTGYSSLNHIREIPFDIIKVDQSFVKDLAGDAYSQSFIKMVAELAETIGVSICVEGIETPAQYKVLQDMKVKYIQGYYFDRPMPCADFEEKYVH